MEQASLILFPPFRLDCVNEQLWQDSQVISLRPKTFAVLRYLVKHAGRLVTKKELLHAIWAGTQVSEAGQRDYIGEIRRALSDNARAPQFLETVHGRGYRFIALLTTAAQPVSSFKFQVPSSKSEPAPSLQNPAPALVGREAELSQLHGWLGEALQGERQLVFVTGEPGIGKTALVEAFLEPVGAHGDAPGGDGAVWIGRGQCIEHYGSGEAYLPVLEALGRLCRGTDGERVVAVLRKHAPMWLVQLPAFIDGEELEALQRKVQGASRERMLRELAEALEALIAVGAGLRPALVLVLEDLHWSDVSTLDLLAFLARRKETARLIVIGTYRPVEMLTEGHPLKSHVQELMAHQLCAELGLGPLSEADIEAYLVTRFSIPSPLTGKGQGEGEKPRLFRSLAHTLHHRTDGNPLFLVSLVNELVARGVLTHTNEGWTLRNDADVIAVGIPETIRQLVAHQRERLQPEEQRMLEAASVAGMGFSAAAVAAALAVDTATVEQRCERLSERQHFLRRVGIEEWPDGTLAARYSFLHALYQQLWHERVSPTQLQYHHLQIGERKERAYGERAREIAAELAVHFEQGRDYRRAIQYLQQAGEVAVWRSAHQEAITLLTKGLELLKMLPDTSERAQLEVALRILLGGSLIATRGFTAPEVETAYVRARELCQQVGETPQLFPALRGVWHFCLIRGELQTARELAEQLLSLAQRLQDPELLLIAHYTLGETLIYLGEFAHSQRYLERSITFYNIQQHRSQVLLYTQDYGVTCLGYTARVLGFLGYPDQSRKKIGEALALAQKLAHPFSLAFALNFAAILQQFRLDKQAAQEMVEAALTYSTEQGFPFWTARGSITRGWMLVEQGQVAKGLAQLQQGIAAFQLTGAGIQRPYFLSLLAEAYGKIEQPEEGLTALAEALAMVQKTGERRDEAELYRLKGKLTLQQQAKVESLKSKVPRTQPLTPNPQAEAEAETCFQKAIEIARQQQAKSWELRATVSLARLWQQQGKKAEARQMLAEIYNWFTEGFDTADLKEAGALLEELS